MLLAVSQSRDLGPGFWLLRAITFPLVWVLDFPKVILFEILVFYLGPENHQREGHSGHCPQGTLELGDPIIKKSNLVEAPSDFSLCFRAFFFPYSGYIYLGLSVFQIEGTAD